MEPKMKSSCVAVLLVLSWCAAAPAAPLALKDCIHEALEHSPALEAGGYDTKAAANEVSKQQAQLLPELSGHLETYMLNGSPVYPFSVLNIAQPDTGVRLPFQAHFAPVAIQGVGVKYPVFENGSLLGLNRPPAVAAANSELAQREFTLLLLQQKVILDVTVAFSNVLWYRHETIAGQAAVELSEKRLAIIASQAAQSLKLPQDVELAKAELASARQAMAAAGENARDVAAELANLMGRPSDQGLELTASLPPPPPLPSLQQFLAQVMPGHPALKVQQGKVEVARQQYRIARSAELPSANLESDFLVGEDLSHFNGGDQHARPTAFITFLHIEVPIFDFHARSSAAGEALDQMGSEQARLAQLDQELRSAVTHTFMELNDIEREIATRQRDCIKADNEQRLARAQTEQKMTDELNLIEAEVASLSAREALEFERVRKRVKYAELQNISGGRLNWLQ
jgi:outer membrane protein TolC